MSTLSNSILACPECARVLPFSHPETNFVLCYCGKVVDRLNGVPNITTLPAIRSSGDALQPGVTGLWKKQSFTLLGRIRIWFGESVLNFWTIQTEKNELLQLMEGYGMYAVLQPIPSPDLYPHYKVDNKAVGGPLQIYQEEYSYILTEKLTAGNFEIEGEILLPFIPQTLRLFNWGTRGKQLLVLEWQKPFARVYEWEAATVASLNLNGLRTSNGTEEKVLCTKCGTVATIEQYPYSRSAVCPNCQSVLDLTKRKQIRVKDSLNSDTEFRPLLLPGATGTLKSIEYKVTGVAKKQELNIDQSEWTEYTLYNPLEGYATLSVYNGHWILLREKLDAPLLDSKRSDAFYFGSRHFELFNAYYYKVIHAAGEFPYDISDSENTQCKEYISPPFIWIKEKYRKISISWFQGEYIKGSTIKNAFSIEAEMPEKIGIGAVEPISLTDRRKMLTGTAIGLLILALVHLVTSLLKEERNLMNATYEFPEVSLRMVTVPEKFVLDKKSSNVEITVDASVNNSWFELTASLVNETTGEEFEKAQGVEYYYGSDEDGRWSEGGTKATFYINNVPAGNYTLQFAGTRQDSQYANQFAVDVHYDVSRMHNLVIFVLLLLIWPLFMFIRSKIVERKRWSNSPFSTSIFTKYEED